MSTRNSRRAKNTADAIKAAASEGELRRSNIGKREHIYYYDKLIPVSHLMPRARKALGADMWP